jgi:hypothetical protein
MSSFVACGSRWRRLAEHSRSSCTFVSISCVQVRIFLLLTMPTRAVSERSRPMRAGFPTGTHMPRSVDEGHSLQGQRECA